MQSRILTFAFMDPPFESARTTTFFRIVQHALLAGHNVNVFAYEGAVSLSSSLQQRHGNALHGHNADSYDHPLPSDWISQLLGLAEREKRTLKWVNCGLCADERGVHHTVNSVSRGSPADFYKMIQQSDNVLSIGTR